jgi:ATP-dependent DNA helicase DinG
MDDSAVQYVADVIAAARTEAKPSGRTLVLVPAYDDVERLKPLLPECLAHEQGTPSWRVLDTYRSTPGCCLITPAAWAGVDLPGLIQCLVIARLPYPPIRPESETFVGALAEMLGKLAQGIGRAIRKEDDEATVWFADPRMPIPECITESTGLLPSEHANKVAIAAIPARFRLLFGRDPNAAMIGVPVGRAELVTRPTEVHHGARSIPRCTSLTKGATGVKIRQQGEKR